jgi:hypothetical protein
LSTEEATQNGTAPPADPLLPIILQLEEQLAPVAAQRAQLEAELSGLKRQEDRIKGAITALRSSAPRGARPAPPPKPQPRGKHDWSPSQQTLDAVYGAIAAADEPLTIAAISDRSGTSKGTTQKAIDELRKVEKVRQCGVASQPGAPRLYGPMP